jgi:hypothetical protein
MIGARALKWDGGRFIRLDEVLAVLLLAHVILAAGG